MLAEDAGTWSLVSIPREGSLKSSVTRCPSPTLEQYAENLPNPFLRRRAALILGGTFAGRKPSSHGSRAVSQYPSQAHFLCMLYGMCGGGSLSKNSFTAPRLGATTVSRAPADCTCLPCVETRDGLTAFGTSRKRAFGGLTSPKPPARTGLPPYVKGTGGRRVASHSKGPRAAVGAISAVGFSGSRANNFGMSRLRSLPRGDFTGNGSVRARSAGESFIVTPRDPPEGSRPRFGHLPASKSPSPRAKGVRIGLSL